MGGVTCAAASRRIICPAPPAHSHTHTNTKKTYRQGSVEPFTLVEGPDAWTAAQYRDIKSWATELSAQHVAELDAAVEAVVRSGVEDIHVSLAVFGFLVLLLLFCACWHSLTTPKHQNSHTQPKTKNKNKKTVTREQFPLPTLGPVLEAVREEVRAGRGFALLRRVPVERYSRREVAIAYWGIGLYWGVALSNNAKGHLIGHIKVCVR